MPQCCRELVAWDSLRDGYMPHFNFHEIASHTKVVQKSPELCKYLRSSALDPCKWLIQGWQLWYATCQ